MAHSISITPFGIGSLPVVLDDKSTMIPIESSVGSSFIVSNTLGINLTDGLNTSISNNVTVIRYNTNSDTYTIDYVYLGSEIYDTEDELIFDFKNGIIYYGDTIINDSVFSNYHKNITGMILSFS